MALTGGLLLLAAGIAPAWSASVETFKWNVSLNGGYTGNVFYSKGNQKISSYGATTKLLLGLDTKTPRSIFGVSYKTNYSWYSGRKVQKANNLSQNLGLNYKTAWSQSTELLLNENIKYTPEQDGFADSSSDLRYTVPPRAQRTTFTTGIATKSETGPRTTLNLHLAHSLTKYGDPVQPPRPPRPDGQERCPPQPLVDRNAINTGASWSLRTGLNSAISTDYSYGRQMFQTNQIRCRRDPLTGELQVRETSVDNHSDTHNLGTGYSWQITEDTRGAVGLGIFRNMSSQGSGKGATSWYVSANINNQLSRRIKVESGVSRSVSSFDGLGTTAVGERVFADFSFSLSKNILMKTRTSYTRTNDLRSSDEVTYVRGALTFNHRVAKWGGYNIAYNYTGQTVKGQVVRRFQADTIQYDQITFGLNFDAQKFQKTLSR